MQTFLSSSSSRPPGRLLGAGHPASPLCALPQGRRAPPQRSPRSLAHRALRAGGRRSPWPRRAGAPRSPRGCQSGRWRPKLLSPRRPPRRRPCAGCPGTRAPAAAPRATCRRAPAGAAHSGCTSPAQVRAVRGAGGRLGEGGRGQVAATATWPAWGVLGLWSRRRAGGGRGKAKLISRHHRPPGPPAAGFLGQRCSKQAAAGAPGGRASLRGGRAALGVRERSRSCAAPGAAAAWPSGRGTFLRATLVPRMGAVLSGGWANAGLGKPPDCPCF